MHDHDHSWVFQEKYTLGSLAVYPEAQIKIFYCSVCTQERKMIKEKFSSEWRELA